MKKELMTADDIIRRFEDLTDQEMSADWSKEMDDVYADWTMVKALYNPPRDVCVHVTKAFIKAWGCAQPIINPSDLNED